MSISEKVLKTIEENNIRPLARWKFVMRNTATWFVGFLAIIAGTLGVSTLLHLIQDNDWNVYQYFGRTFFEHVLTVFPYFWLVALAAFVFLAYVLIRHTRTGYRYTTLFFIATILSTSIILGAIFFMLGTGEYVENALSKNIGAYAALPHNKLSIWNKPRIGLLSGTITEIEGNDEFILNDFTNQEWMVIEDNALWQNKNLRTMGTRIKLLGAYENNGVFIATEIRPWDTENKKVK